MNTKIDEKIYKAINALYSNNEACVRLGTQNTEWFAVPNGVHQGDPLSTTLFSMYNIRGTWGETGHGVSWDSLNIKMRSLPLDVLSYVLTQLGFRRTYAARIAKITQAVCDVTT